MWLPPAVVVAFQEVKLKCMTAPVLTFADFHKPFLLETDASGDGLGAVLSQKAGGWTLSPGCLRQPRLESRRTEIPFIQVRVPRPQVGQ